MDPTDEPIDGARAWRGRYERKYMHEFMHIEYPMSHECDSS